MIGAGAVWCQRWRIVRWKCWLTKCVVHHLYVSATKHFIYMMNSTHMAYQITQFFSSIIACWNRTFVGSSSDMSALMDHQGFQDCETFATATKLAKIGLFTSVSPKMNLEARALYGGIRTKPTFIRPFTSVYKQKDNQSQSEPKGDRQTIRFRMCRTIESERVVE